jgi:hypothetical protein
MYYMYHHGNLLAVDFHNEFWPAGWRVLHGLSPYTASAINISRGVAFPYPAFAALTFVPFALLNHALADWTFTAVNIVAVNLTLRTLQVRDWRLYGLVLAWWPVVVAWQTANVTLVLGLGIAWLWRKRDHPLVAGALVAAMISLKPFVWPIALWLLATRRYRALGYAVATGLVLNAISWAVVGVNQFHAYASLTSAVNNAMDRRGYGIFSLVMQLGGGRGLAYALGIGVAVVVASACFVAGRRGDTRTAFILCIADCLLATPVIWSHYFALMIVPLAVCRRRLDRLWLAPLAMIVCPPTNPALWQIGVALTVGTIVFVGLLRSHAPRASAEQAGLALAGNELAIQFEN